MAFPMDDDRVNRDAEMQQDKPEVASFISAAGDGDIAGLQDHLAGGADINLQNLDGYTALIAAVTGNQPDMVAALVVAGAKLDEIDNNGFTALLWAAFYGHQEIVTTLVQAGAKLDMADNEGGTALIWAARNGFTEIVDQLLKAGAHLEGTDKDGDTALTSAARNGHADSAALIEEGVEKLRLARAWSAGKASRDHDTLKNNAARGKLKLPGSPKH